MIGWTLDPEVDSRRFSPREHGRRRSGRARRLLRQWPAFLWFCWYFRTSRHVPDDCRSASDAGTKCGSVLHSTGAGSAASRDRSWCTCTTDRGEIGSDPACALIVEQIVAVPLPQIMRTCDADASEQLDAVYVGVHFSPSFHCIFRTPSSWT